jgi:hypothetical protein
MERWPSRYSNRKDAAELGGTRQDQPIGHTSPSNGEERGHVEATLM